MAEFCTDCAKKIDVAPEIDVEKIFKRLKPGYQQSVLCEGCGLVALHKEEEDLTEFHGYYRNGKIEWVENLKDLV